jgi:hypothetical protein
MSLIEEIQAGAISETGDVSALLRKCKLLAARLDNREFAEWVDRELGGYPSDLDLPQYRLVQTLSYGNFVGPYGMQASRQQIPLSLLPENLRATYRQARLDQAISAYQSFVDDDPVGRKGSLHSPWPAEMALHYGSKLMNDMQCVAAWREIPFSAIHILLNAVRTAILGFAIDIQREAPDAGESPVGAPRPIPEERVTQIFNTNIAGSVGNIANGGSAFHQTATVGVQVADWDGLSRYLQSLGIPEQASPELKNELESVRAAGAESGRLRGREIIGRLVAKAASCSSGVAVELAATGIAKAIAGYLGFDIG